jgi:hypothetical protein
MNREPLNHAGGYRLVRSDRGAGPVRVGDEVVVIPVEDVVARPELLELPTVRRVAREGRKSVVLVPLAEWRAKFPYEARG